MSEPNSANASALDTRLRAALAGTYDIERELGGGGMSRVFVAREVALDRRVVFLLWGGYARKKAALITGADHVVLEAGHPSPLNPRGFRGCRAFSAANKALADAGLPTVNW